MTSFFVVVIVLVLVVVVVVVVVVSMVNSYSYGKQATTHISTVNTATTVLRPNRVRFRGRP